MHNQGFLNTDLKEMVSSCLRPALSMREAATTVISTFMTCTPTLASAALVIPACKWHVQQSMVMAP